MSEKENGNLISWLDIGELKSIQQSFYHIAGMPVSVVSYDGVPLSPKIGGTTYCDILVQQSSEAYSMCSKCRLYGARECLQLKRPTHYYCHMGLVEFTVPLIIDDKPVAYMTGGMVFDRPPIEYDIRSFASKFNIDPDFLWEAAQKVPIRSQNILERAAEGLFNYASIISASADIKIKTHRASEDVERAAQMKNDFLANMSHEIRTPMNAVIGMAELATQEEISPAAREYLENIQSSGKTLLHIINDILDYSKISSGKMSIFEDKFSVAGLIRDITSIITTRLLDKSGSIYLFVNVSPVLPSWLIGDVARIQQIIINLANNAVKFTNSGSITIGIEGEVLPDGKFLFSVSVKDTGIGIRHEDMEKLFSSFTQVDSRRNRNVEGTGLGLAIVRQLVSLMNGKVSLESVYGVGSTFSFEIPLTIYDPEKICSIEDPKKYAVLMSIQNNNVFTAVHESFDYFGVHTQTLDVSECSASWLSGWIDEHHERERFVVIDQKAYEAGFLEKAGLGDEPPSGYRIILISDTLAEDSKVALPNYIHVIKLPVTTVSLSAAIQGDFTHPVSRTPDKSNEYRFTAPDARIMVVDDIPMNLKLAERLLARLKIKTDLASSGQEALELLVKEQYDIIFMDHMMPGLDGIDTTRLIRRFHPKYNKTPIIALTANVMEDAKKMFLIEGMSDIIPKPIEVKTLNEKLLKWLPPEKIIPTP